MHSTPSPSLASVILPTYNEAGNVVDLIGALHAEIRQPHEIIVVDDNSPDGTSQLVQELIARGTVPGLRLETRTADRGLRNSIWRGIELAKGDIICWCDCDFSHPPATMAELVAKVDEGYDLAVASRFASGGSYKRGIGWFGADESALAVLLSRWINWFVRRALHPGFHDYTSGFIAARRTIFTKLKLRGDYGEYFIDFMFRAILLGYKYVEVPFVSPSRRSGVSKTGTTFWQLFKRGRKYVTTVRRMGKIRRRHKKGGEIGDGDALA